MRDYALAALSHWELIGSGVSALVGLLLTVLDVAGLRPAAEQKLQAAGTRIRAWAQKQWRLWNTRELPPHPNVFIRAGNAVGRGLFHAMPIALIVPLVSVLANPRLTSIFELIPYFGLIAFLILLVLLAAVSTLLAVANTLLLFTWLLALSARGPAGTLGIIGVIVAVLGFAVFFYQVAQLV